MSIVGFSGCHSSWPFDSSAPLLENAQFMDIWETYLHCRSSTEPDEIRADLQRLNIVARTVATQNEPSALLPAGLRSRITAPPSRLAVDPRSMAVSCALHGREVAQSAGQPELNAELSTAVGSEQAGSAYASYEVESYRRPQRIEERIFIVEESL